MYLLPLQCTEDANRLTKRHFSNVLFGEKLLLPRVLIQCWNDALILPSDSQ